MFLKIWNYLRGYVIIEVSGFSAERFINLAVHKGIYLWDIMPTQKGILMKVSIKGFKRLKECSKKTRCKVKIKSRFGCPFFIFKHRKQKFYLLGIIIFIALLYTLSSFVWLINIEGNDRISQDTLLSFCSDRGFKVGSFKPSLDTKALEKELKNNFSDLSWIAISINGTCATIKMTETILAPEILDYSKPCDIIAEGDGVITSIVASTGSPKVKAKDVVKKGDVLVSGELIVMEDETGTVKKYVHSIADIKAKQWHTINIEIPYKYYEKKYTENCKKRYEINVLNKNFNLDFVNNLIKNNISYEKYDKITSVHQLKASENYALPITIIKNEYKEYELIEHSYDYEQAKELAEKQLSREILKTFDVNTDIHDKECSFSETQTSLNLNAKLTIIKNIGIQRELN